MISPPFLILLDSSQTIGKIPKKSFPIDLTPPRADLGGLLTYCTLRM